MIEHNGIVFTGKPNRNEVTSYNMLMSGLALFLVLVANSAPILIRQLAVFRRYTQPLDFHINFFDHRPLLGKSKTWRGLFASVLLTTVCSGLLQTGWMTGAIVALLAMLGDSLSSFMKRRLGLPASTMAVGIDQIPESLFPLIYLHLRWQLNWSQMGLIVAVFVILELVFSRILFRLHIRKHPY